MASPVDETNAMNAKDATEYVVDQGLYYSPSNYYGYYSTGYESPVEWDDHHRFFCIDGHDLNYTNLQTESLPYVYYAPSYVYPQSPYNPYNPYIPGNFIGLDGSLVGSHQYYSGSTFQHPVSSPASVQVPQSSLVTNSPDIPVLITSSTNATMRDSVGFVHTPSFVSGKATNSISRTEPSRATSGQTYSSRISEGRQASSVPIKLAAPQRSNSSSNVPQIPSSDTSKDSSLGGVSNTRSPPRINVPTANPLPDFVSPINGWTMVDARPRLSVSGSWANGNGRLDTLGEQNRGPRTNRLNIQTMKSIIVKAYTSKAGTVNEDGNIIIHTDHYNREDFPINYVDAKFFVIKSYSEDDIHKSIKYNVWSSTPNGNKRLDAAYEEVHKITGTKCPIFLFFSVNASGQFCGVAEMVGPVDFQKNMDFWQQDKWSGSFPVKWHIIKDVRNANFRHIILENNENKPVTNSRDTQEIPFRQGMEMLAIFKDYACKTSILDDFIYYEDRQKIMQDEKSRFPRFNGPLFFSTSENSSSPNTLTVSSDKTETTAENIPPTNKAHSVNHESKQTELTDNTITQSEGIDIGSLSIHSKEEKSIEEKKVGTVDDSQDNTVTVGSFPLKVAGLTEPPGLLTIGSIPINPNASKPS